MYLSIKNTVERGIFKFSDMRNRILKVYAMGGITETQLDELMDLAYSKANPEEERPEMLILLQRLSERVDTLEKQMKELTPTHGTDDPESTSFPMWKPWDGLSDKYQTGAVVSHGGQLWQSVYPGQNVWEPGVVDDRFWIHYTPEEADT